MGLHVAHRGDLDAGISSSTFQLLVDNLTFKNSARTIGVCWWPCPSPKESPDHNLQVYISPCNVFLSSLETLPEWDFILITKQNKSTTTNHSYSSCLTTVNVFVKGRVVSSSFLCDVIPGWGSHCVGQAYWNSWSSYLPRCWDHCECLTQQVSLQ